MASTKRERELARLRLERQAARRAAEAARRRQRRRTTIITAAVIAAAAVVAVLVIPNVDGSSKPKRTPAAAAGMCTYTPSGTAARQVTGQPASTGVAHEGTQSATLQTNRGTIKVDLLTGKAPCTVNSFVFLAQQKYFDGTPCHRLTTSGILVLQCGDPTGKGTGGPGYQFGEENLSAFGSGTTVTYPKGTLAMANAGPGTNGSQFFLVYGPSPLPPSYTPFGTITSGLDVLAKVAKAGSTPPGDGKPKLAVTLTKVTV